MNITKTDLETFKKEGLAGIKAMTEILAPLEELLAGIEKTQQVEAETQKEQILKRYANEEPTEFRQFYVSYDGLAEREEAFSRDTWELMDDSPAQVLIKKGTRETEAVYQLLKIVDCIVRFGL
jgi:hypothetical protein